MNPGTSPVAAHPYDDYSVSDALVEALAEAEGVDPLALDPVYEHVDTDALDGLFADRVDGGIAVSFDIWGYHVVIEDGIVSVFDR